MKLKSFTALSLCLVILLVIALGGCQSKDKSSHTPSTQDEVSVTKTESVSVAPSSDNTMDTSQITTAPTGSSDVTSPALDATEEATEKATEDNAKKDPQSNSQSDSQSGNSGSSQSGKPSDSQQSNQKMTCTITVGNKDYTAKYGDIVTYSYYLKAPKAVECLQAKVNYTGRSLKLIDDDQEKILPVISNDAVLNLENPGVVYYNYANLKGYSFKKEGVLITLRFEVIFGGSASITNAIEIMDGIGEIPYVDNYKFSKDVKYRETLKIS